MEETTSNKLKLYPRKALKSTPSSKPMKTLKVQNLKLVSVGQIISQRLSSLPQNAIPTEPGPPQPSRPHLIDPMVETFEMNDYASVVDQSRALKKFTPKKSSGDDVIGCGGGVMAVVKEKREEPTREKKSRRFVGRAKKCTYKLHSMNTQQYFNIPPPFKAIQIGEVKRTYGKPMKKNPPPIANERVEVKIECDPEMLLNSIDAEVNAEVRQEKGVGANFEFINVKQETEIIDCDEYISD